MAGVSGQNLYLLFAGNVLDTDYRSFSQSEEMGVVDVSAGADADRTYVDALKDGTASATLVVQSDDTTTWGYVALGTEGTLEWGVEGTASGNMRSYVTAIVIGRSKSMEYDDVAVFDVEWQFSGAVTDTTY
jgi:hypothetical protein